MAAAAVIEVVLGLGFALGFALGDDDELGVADGVTTGAGQGLSIRSADHNSLASAVQPTFPFSIIS